MTATLTTKHVTGDELITLPNIESCELIGGRIKYMSPNGWQHGRLESQLNWHLKNFVTTHDLGEVLVGEVGIYIRREPDRIRAADVAFISKKRLETITSTSYLDTAPDLIIEIISPADQWEQVRQKLEDYFAIGVSHVWIVEPKNQTILVFRSPTELKKYEGADVLVGEGVLDGFTLSLDDLFLT